MRDIEVKALVADTDVWIHLYPLIPKWVAAIPRNDLIFESDIEVASGVYLTVAKPSSLRS